MKFEIKSRFEGVVLFSCETETLQLCVSMAIKSGANLYGANLYGADLSRANLSGANLYGANLYGADLSRANLSGANLSEADLSGANLSEADLSGANLSGAYLSGADLSEADLSGADLSGAYLSGADLSEADLSGADLSRANLSGANLSRANLYGANLSEANLSEANLYGANLSGAVRFDKLQIARTQIVPQEGAFVGWKKLKGDIVARLVIPHDAQRLNAYSSRKCRASKVIVHEMFGATEAYDRHSGRVLYTVDATVTPDSFDPDKSVECSHGIHFFLTREEAEAY